MFRLIFKLQCIIQNNFVCFLCFSLSKVSYDSLTWEYWVTIVQPYLLGSACTSSILCSSRWTVEQIYRHAIFYLRLQVSLITLLCGKREKRLANRKGILVFSDTAEICGTEYLSVTRKTVLCIYFNGRGSSKHNRDFKIQQRGRDWSWPEVKIPKWLPQRMIVT